MDMTVVYKDDQNGYKEVLDFLRKQGFNAIAFNDPNEPNVHIPAPFYHYGKRDNYIAVPNDEKHAALLVLKKWEQEKQHRIDLLSKDIKKTFAFATKITLISAIALAAFGFWEYCYLLPLVWFSLVIIVGNAEKIKSWFR